MSNVTRTNEWTWIWKLNCTERVKLFMWLLKRGSILTNSVRFTRHITPSPVCPSCEQSPETPINLFKDCYYSRLVWESLNPLPTDFFHLDFESWLRKFATASRGTNHSQDFWDCVFLATIWHLWKSRNRLVFDEQRIPPHLVARQAHAFALETRLALEATVIHATRTPKWASWSPPPPGYLKLNTDGSRDHHSGRAAAGGLLCDHNRCWHHGFATNVGLTSSFLAEMWGCREGFKLAISLGVQQLVLELDSLLAIQFIQGRQKSARSASVLLANILLLIDSFSICLVQHTLREGNSAADFMASMGHDLALGTTFYPTPPVGINMILHSDCIGTVFLRK
ncbi:hypothetical protein SLA2020_349530 [Shorea laevis]